MVQTRDFGLLCAELALRLAFAKLADAQDRRQPKSKALRHGLPSPALSQTLDRRAEGPQRFARLFEIAALSAGLPQKVKERVLALHGHVVFGARAGDVRADAHEVLDVVP